MGAPQSTFSCSRRRKRCVAERDHRNWKAEHARQGEQAEAGGDRQRHGRHPDGRGAAGPRARSLRHHRVRFRALRQLQPDSAVAGARRREDRQRHHAQHRAVVRGQRHHAAQGRTDRDDRSAHLRSRHRRRRAGALRPPADRHRFEPDHAAAAGQGPAWCHRLSRHPGCRAHGAGLDRITRTPS